MTAEISIMNKRAIALATDSAITLGRGDKVYNTADKLFALSKYHPVGIMIYNNSEFMGVPWEIIIKEYREHLKSYEFDCLHEYGKNFFEFLYDKKLNLVAYEERYFRNSTRWLIKYIDKKIQGRYKNAVSKLNRKLNTEELNRVIAETISSTNNTIQGIKPLENLPNDFELYILSKYKDIADKIIDETIKLSIIPSGSLDVLYSAICKSFSTEMRTDNYTGIVIAGFGKADVFPKLISYEAYGMMKGHIKYREIYNLEIDTEQDYYIIPFAQTDTVDTFLHGISPTFLDVVNDSFEKHILCTVDGLDEKILNKEGKKQLIGELKDKWNAVSEGITDYSNDIYFYPILRAVRSLPKDELASMAESLVNLTSFKRQVALDEYSHTVGGPIDVAVISKGDGFIWIKRKHYFSPELNNHFFKNYYRKCEEVVEDEKL